MQGPTREPRRQDWHWPVVKLRWALLVLGLLVLNGLRLAWVVNLDLRASGVTCHWGKPLVWELSSALVVWATVPLAQLVALNAPWPPAGRVRFLVLHGTGAILFWIVHVAGMWGLRILVYPLLGFGSYDYGDVSHRVAMEGLKDILTFAVLAGIFHFLELRRARLAREVAALRLQSELREARLQALSGQLDPHFLFNALNTVSSVMYEDLAKTDRLLASLAQMLRDGLEAGGPTWTLQRELQHLDAFLTFAEARFSDRLRIERQIEAGLGDLQVPRFCVQRLVENALKHNQDAPGKVLKLSIAIRSENDQLRLEVQDDGDGFKDPAKALNGTGVGLRNLGDVLALQYSGKSALEVSNPPEGGARVILRIPRETING